MIGSDDAVPPGFRPPGYGSLQEPFPGGIGGTGGMHMGPDDPLFAGRAGRGRPGMSGALPPGARYDPIGPPGMPVRLLAHATHCRDLYMAKLGGQICAEHLERQPNMMTSQDQFDVSQVWGRQAWGSCASLFTQDVKVKLQAQHRVP